MKKSTIFAQSYLTLKQIQQALVYFGNSIPYPHPTYGNLGPESFKIIVVDPLVDQFTSQIHILPDTNLGYTKKFLFDYLEEFGLVDQFEKWIHGHTTGVDQQNEPIYFTVDVLNFFSELRK